MREIKFRAFDKSNHKIFNCDNFECQCSHGGYGDMLNDIFKSDDYIFIQYTGLKDKNGIEIYEGDIIKGGIYLAYEVEWDYESSGWNISSNIQHNYEVIGNIYEHPHLLGKQND